MIPSITALVLGSGGREHALAWKLRQSGAKVTLHPGNSGTKRAGFQGLEGVNVLDPRAIIRASKRIGFNLIVIGPEAFLERGYAEIFRGEGFPVVGPGKSCARLETSKVFAKRFMEAASIPTAPYRVVENIQELHESLTDRNWPKVLKYDGLAAGKGVIIASDVSEASQFAKRVWDYGEFGGSNKKIIVEKFIAGHELSYIGLCDARTFLPLSSATDFKRVLDGNQGPNTGGMGSISPSPLLTPAVESKIRHRVVDPILAQFAQDRWDYRGVLYIGLMIDTGGNPTVLEFNTRFGDPETQAILLRLRSSFLDLLLHTASATLDQCPPPSWSDETSIFVVAAAEGYPTSPVLGDPISGIEERNEEAVLFFSGVGERDSQLVTSGGRVLGLGALDRDSTRARGKVYQGLAKLHWRGMHYRKDIGVLI